ncbi:hypothetical protein [Catenuloplanes atrovinosus]|uniref:Uncharacterized protein n=1 Tax=Catenuloplanes atrovinosus TaxID=137266 RepID=A0AAE3YH56_9ACTN|nr:hypothetical protein [Catenuloplanes atrovinosus]MDR7273350.1 hypothetical protein [Catenuloplanes atrovinosus]
MSESPQNRGLALWLPFAGVILAAVITGVFALVAARDNDAPDAAVATSPPAPPAAVTTPAAATTTGASPTPGSTPAGTELFNAPITFQAGSDSETDLDGDAPKRTPDDEDNDILLEPDMREDAGDLSDFDGSALIAKWDGDGTPGYEQCRQAAANQGITTVEDVRKGTVLCVRTSEGRIVRMIATDYQKFHSMTFDTVMWSA